MVIVTASEKKNNFHTLLFQTGHSLSQKLTVGNSHITACFKSSQQHFPQFQSPEKLEVLITDFIFKANVTSQWSSKADLRHKHNAS